MKVQCILYSTHPSLMSYVTRPLVLPFRTDFLLPIFSRLCAMRHFQICICSLSLSRLNIPFSSTPVSSTPGPNFIVSLRNFYFVSFVHPFLTTIKLITQPLSSLEPILADCTRIPFPHTIPSLAMHTSLPLSLFVQIESQLSFRAAPTRPSGRGNK